MRHIRVQQQGGCTPTVSIPQEFAQELGIRKGDSLRVTVEVDRRPSRSTGIASLHYRAVVPDGGEHP